MQKCRYFFRQNKLLSNTGRSYRSVSSIKNILGRQRNTASLGSQQMLFNILYVGNLNNTSRRINRKETQHGLSKNIAEGSNFRENTLKNSLNIILSRGNKLRKTLSFSGDITKVSQILIDGYLINKVLMNKDKSGDSKSIFLISFSLPESKFGKISDEQRINDNCIKASIHEKRKQINVIASSRLHSDNRICSNTYSKLFKACNVHISRERESNNSFLVERCYRKRILRYIDTYKQISHSNTSVVKVLDMADIASQPILHLDKGLKTQPTYHGLGRQGTHSIKGSTTQVNESSPANPSYKSYRDNSYPYISYNIYSS
ncbi:transposase [Candidatus Magnetoovum chiemensis]|nr:transposase [Candidatus Magnetoovum chiemensis]